MKLGIMQPYFFPYLGHFALIANVDRWVVFDVTQYTPKTWMNRNRVLHPKEGWQYLSVPLANSSISILTREARVLDLGEACRSVLGKLTHYKRHAPYYRAIEALVARVMQDTDDPSLVHLNVRGLSAVCEYLGLRFDYQICSELDLPLPEAMAPGEWAPTISALLGANGYVNPAGGRELFDPEHFASRDISLEFLSFDGFTYDTGPHAFEPGLSIIDVLMWNSPQVVLDAIHAGSRLLQA
ncbi:WbqC family protein [Paraburkholderia sp. HP33-1]|uniref:WbqC family protein n=1 Tax=Paraburkholderia sp. HP33-1 TaxID=2883243 RepID=UPI001F272CF5|nr:WbqC family protein [Paraburkholderia sp. HP33-1]